VKLSYEWPAKFNHFGAYVKKEAAEKYETYLGNNGPEGRLSRNLPPRLFISGHLTHKQDGESDADYKAREHKAWADLKDPKVTTVQVEALDEENAKDPKSTEHDRAHFIPREVVHMHHPVVLEKADLLPNFGPFYPRLNTYLACYFMITGLHGAHVLGGVLVFLYFWGPGSKLFKTNPEQLSNRIEVAGLFWHLVDLIWIFVFPLFYLL